ncbi:MAG: fasciclin domain-containing protein [Pseudomonadota bacterium]
MKRAVCSLLFLLAATVVSFAQDERPTLIEAARETGRFSQFLALAEEAGLLETLAGAGPFTVFAPTDGSFPASFTRRDTVTEENRERVAFLIALHIVPGAFTFDDLRGRMSPLVSLDLVRLTVRAEGGLAVQGVPLGAISLEASNGIIYPIDRLFRVRPTPTRRPAATAPARRPSASPPRATPRSAPTRRLNRGLGGTSDPGPSVVRPRRPNGSFR